MQPATVPNPSRFQSSYNTVSIGSNSSRVVPMHMDMNRDADFQFLRVVKECFIHMDRAMLVQSLPSTPLTDFHLYWLISLASAKEEAQGIAKHIFSTYSINADKALVRYYSSKLDRIMGVNTEDIEDID
jgi:hypothetical protein